MSFADKVKNQEEEARKEGHVSSSGDWYKFVEGDNRFRVLSEPEMMFEKYQVGICYTDCGYEGTSKFLTYVLDRKDGKVKLAKLPYTVGTAIIGYEKDEEYHFEGFPMPYDIKVNAVGAGTKEVKYTVMAGRSNTDVEASILADVNKRKSIADIIKKMKENKKAEHIADGTFQKNQNAKDEVASKRTHGGGKVVDTIEYPEEEINPEDIPF